MSAFGMTKGEKFFNYFNIALLTLLSVVTIYPFLYVLFASFSNPADLMKHKGLLLGPLGFELGSYKLVFENPIIGISYLNTLLYVTVGTALSVFLTVLGAYAFSRKGTMWGTPILFAIIFTMWFKGGMIPFFLVIRDLGMLNTRWAMILPRAIITYNLIVMRTSFQAIPDSLEESARIDGANDFAILFKIFIPLSLPVLSVITLFYSVSFWNRWFDAMLFINERTLYPLQLILREILILNNTDAMMAGAAAQSDQIPIGETIKYSTVIVAIGPILAVYPFLQKYFVKGVMVGAVKG